MLAAKSVPAGVIDQAELAADAGQARVGIVFAQLQPELGAAGKHAVGLGHALGDQVVHQHAKVGLVAPGQPAGMRVGGAGAGLQSGVDSGKQTLGRRFFVASSAVDLPGKKQALNLARLKVAFQGAGVKVVVLDGIAGPQNMRILQPHHAAHQVVLDVKRQAGGDAIGVVLVGAQALGLQKNLVAFLVGKAVDLVLHAGAIARAHALDGAGKHGAAVKAAADDFVGARIGMRHPARHLLRVLLCPAHEAEHRHLRGHAAGHAIAGLRLAAGKVDAAPVDARWRAGLEAALGQLQFFQARTQARCRRVASAARAIVVHAHVNLAVQKRARREHDRGGFENNSYLGNGSDDAVALHEKVIHRLLEQRQMRLVLQHAAYRCLVQHAVGLGAGGAHGRAFAGIEDTKLDAALVSSQGHGAAQGVDFFNQMAFANAANRGVTAHLPQGFDVVREQQGAAPHARRCQRSFGAGMAAADNDHIKVLGIQHGARVQSEGEGHFTGAA